MTTFLQSRLPLFITAIAFGWGGIQTLCGQITASITSTTGPTGTLTAPHFVIDSDSTNGAAGYTRDTIPVSADVRFERAVIGTEVSESYRIVAELLDDTNTPVLLSNGLTYSNGSENTVNFSFFQSVRTFTWNLALDPATDLGEGRSYTIRVHMERKTLVTLPTTPPILLPVWTDVLGVVTTTTAFTVVHFADLPDDPASRYARGYTRGAPTWAKTFAVNTGNTATRRFTANVPYSVFRYDVGGSTQLIGLRFTGTLTDDLGNIIPLESGGVSTTTLSRAAFTAGTPNTPVAWNSTFTYAFAPVGQLDSRNRTYRLTVRFEHIETTPSVYRDNGTTPQSSLQRLLHFNGKLIFGTTNTAFTSLLNSPTAGSLGAGYVNTTVNPPSGTIPGFASYSVGAGVTLDVRLQSNGDAVVTAGTRPIETSASGLTASYGGIRVSYLGGNLTPAGPEIEATVVHLPQGLAYTPNRSSSAGRYRPEIIIPGIRLLTNLFRHTGDLALALPSDAWVFDEARPVLYRVMQFEMPQDGTLRFKGASSEWAHRGAFAQLEAQQAAGQHASTSMAYRLGNDGYLRFSSIPNGSFVTFTRAADGSVRTRDAELEVQPGSFHTHMPLNSKIGWGSGGTIKISNGIVSADSVLTGASETKVAFDGSCEGDSCGPAPGSVVAESELRPNDDEWRFSADGGLWALGKALPLSLKWGIRDGNIPTHQSGPFNEGAFLAPGHQLYAANNPLNGGPMAAHAAQLAPATITLAGVEKDNPSLPVYPETNRYRDGVGFYPGATFTVTSPAQSGASQIADMTSPASYSLQEIVSKYYIRRSGISGRHVAAEGTFPDTLELYDYKFGFSRYQLTFLSNKNADSWVNGGVEIPNPSGFSQRFLGLRLSCTGALESAEIDPDDAGSKPLNYWNGSFTPIAMRFAPQEGAGCYADRFLTIGLVSGAANIETPLAGTLAFLPTGNIGTLDDEIVGVDGRLGLPARVPMAGPGSETYQLVPVTKLYFNNPALPGAPSSGFVNFAASCDVPFFQDLKIHVMTSAQAGIPAPMHVAGGWTDASQTFFTNSQFDRTHRGFPTATSLTNYQSPTNITPYVVRAKQSLFGLVNLDYPLKWQGTSRYFESWPEDPTDLFVVTVEHQVDYLSANNAELSFGAQYEGLPKINLVSTAFDLVDGELGAARALTNAARQFVTDTLNQGVTEVGNLVNDTMENVLDQAIDSIEDEVINPLYDAVVQSYNTAAAANTTYGAWVNSTTGTLKLEFDRYLDGSIGLAANSVKGRLQQLGDAGNEAANLVSTVSDAVDAGILAIDSVVGRIQIVGGQPVFNETMPPLPTIPSTDVTPVINGIISGILAKETGTGGQLERQIVQKLVSELIGQLAPPDLAAIINPLLADLSSELNAELNELLSEFDPTLDRITEVLLEARGYLVIVKGKLAAGQDIITAFNQIVANATAEIDAIVNSIRATAYGFIDTIAASATYLPTTALNAAGSLLNEFDKDEFVALLRAELRDRLLATEFIQQIQYTLRQYISELDMAMRSAIDSAFNEVSRMCKELIKSALGPIDDAINGLTGDINQYVGAGSVDGYAHIQGDTLRRLRLDAKIELKVPDELRLQAFIEINCYDSSTTTGTSVCISPGEQVLEVKIGAFDVPLDWISPDMRADLSVWFSMRTSPDVMPRGIGGALTMTGGELDFQSLKITGFGASVAVGLDECFIAATARVIVSSYEASGGIFFGRTCTLEPLLIVDPDAASILGTPPFTGAYVYGEVWIPISEVVLGIPASCLFRISAGVGAGAFFFVEGPTFGGKMLLGVSGEALCIVSIRGEVALTGVMAGGSLRFTGRGTLTGKAGYCPFCIKFRESAKVTYQDGSWSVDF